MVGKNIKISRSIILFAWLGTLIVAFCGGLNYEQVQTRAALNNASLLINDICLWVRHEEDTYFGGWPMICKDLELNNLINEP